jgi:arylsulfatase A-like enzyme
VLSAPPGRGATWLVSLVAGLLAATCAPPPPPRPAARSPHVFLLSLDTLRADAVGARDAGGVAVTPNLDALARRSSRFGRATSEIPFTLPAHMTLLTGVAPDVHAVFGEDDRLAPGVPTLAETLAAAGYRTGAVVSSDWLRPGFGFGRGFERYEELPLDLEFGERVDGAAWSLFDELAAGGEPVFLLVHYYDAHSDFELHGNRRPYWSPAEETSGLAAACREGLCAPDGRCATGFLLWADHHPEAVPRSTRDCLWQSYLAGVRALDAGVGAFIDELTARGLLEHSLLVVTSDHGEEFGEHGQFIHAQTFGESLAVPLLIRRPGPDEPAVGDRAQLADLVPTILREVGIAVPSTVTGHSLFDDAWPRPPALAQNKYRPRRYAWLEGEWKLVHDYVTDETRLYDLASDPGELTDVAAARPEVVEALRARLDERVRALHERYLLAAEGVAPGEPFDAEARRRLEALGYVDR